MYKVKNIHGTVYTLNSKIVNMNAMQQYGIIGVQKQNVPYLKFVWCFLASAP